MGNWVTISTTGAGGYPSVPPPAFVIDSADGRYDVNAGELTIRLAVHPLGSLGTIVGGHVYLEVPDQSARSTTTFKLATSTLAGADKLRGSWRPLDVGQFPYVAEEQPWVVTLLIKTNTLHAGGSATNVRVYVSAYSDEMELPLVRAGSTGETPSIVCTVDPTVQKTDSGSSYAPNVDHISVVVGWEDDSTGKLYTPIAITVFGLPDPMPSGWGYEVCVTWDETNPDFTNPNIGQPVTGIFNTAGLVPAGPDPFTWPHTVAFPTTTRIVSGVFWLRALIQDATGIHRNAIKPGVTPSGKFNMGVVDSTTDGGSIMQDSVPDSAISSVRASTVNGVFYASSIASISASTINGIIFASSIGSVNASTINGLFYASSIGSVNANVVNGIFFASSIASISASTINGIIFASSIGSVNASTINGVFYASSIASVKASTINGLFYASSIASVTASTINGMLYASSIGSVQASTINGSINASNIGSVQASTINGAINASNIGSVQASVINGALYASSIASINATTINGLIVTSQIAGDHELAG